MFKDVIFHNAAEEAGNGNEVFVNRSHTLTVEIFGTSETRTVTFYGKGLGGELRAIEGEKLAASTTKATSTTGNDEFWRFKVVGLVSVVMDLTAVSGGNVSVKGRLIE
ncbi:MAG TPA: hypothetical protein VEF53_19020 [Patescibacteria group bacterium]|nr:hypothetical protein [Patescibacteria group bacterium]